MICSAWLLSDSIISCLSLWMLSWRPAISVSFALINWCSFLLYSSKKAAPFCLFSVYLNKVCDVSYILLAILVICYFISTEAAANLTFKSKHLDLSFDNSTSNDFLRSYFSSNSLWTLCLFYLFWWSCKSITLAKSSALWACKS